jgi:hypothetical protein
VAQSSKKIGEHPQNGQSIRIAIENGTNAGLKVRNCAAFHGEAVLTDGYFLKLCDPSGAAISRLYQFVFSTHRFRDELQTEYRSAVTSARHPEE